MKLAAGVLVGMLLLGSGAAAVDTPTAAAVTKSATATKAGASKARGILVVRAIFLGKAKKPRVRILGKGAPKRSVKLGKRLRLPAGNYTLVSTPVKTKRGIRYTASKRMKVRVRGKKTTRATLRYRVLVPARTRVVSRSAARRITAVTDRSLRMPAKQARALRPGNIIVSGVTPAAPEGLLRKVVSTKVSGRSTIVTTAPATLRDAVPEGEFSLRIGEDGRVSGSGLMEKGQREHATVTMSHTFKLDRAWQAGDSDRGCAFTGTGLRANAQITPKAAATVSASWKAFGSPELSVDSSLEVNGAASIEGEVSGSCTLTKRSPVVRLAAITAWAGPIPVVLTPALSASANLTVGSSLKANVGASLSARVSGGFTYKNGIRFRGDSSRSLNPTTVTFGESAGNAKLTISPEFSLLAYGAAGPKLSFSGGIEGTVQPSASPWWWLDGYVDGRVGAKFAVLGIDVNADHSIFKRTWRISDSGPRPADGGDEPPTATPVQVPVVTCPLTFHPFLPKDRNPIPSSLPATLPADAAANARFFSNGDIALLGPAEFGCTSITGGDGTMKMLVAPGTPRFASDGGMKPDRGLYAYVFFRPSEVVDMACPYFAKARARAIGSCRRPPGEQVTVVDERTVLITAPPGVSGVGYPSGDALTARTVMQYQDEGPKLSIATCTLPESDAPLCDAALTAFAAKVGQ